MKESAASNDPSTLTLASHFQSKEWFIRHLHAAIYTLGRLVRAPSNILTAAALTGVALALPTTLYVILENVKMVTPSWNVGAQISLYLDGDLSDEDAALMGAHLSDWTDIERVEIITKAEALAEYQQFTGLSELLSGENNPLPPVLIVTPSTQGNDFAISEQLVHILKQEPGIDIVQSDNAWLARLQAIRVIPHRTIWLLVALLSAGILLVVGNTIRLEIQNRYQEIELSKLVGATDAFIRRPFLYNGLWCGVLGALFAWSLLIVIFGLLKSPVDELSALYNSHFRLEGPSNLLISLLLLGGALLGLGGSWITFTRHLGTIEPG